MCTGVEIAGLALAAGGSVLQANAADDAANNQQRIINQADEQTKKLNQQKQLITQDFADKTFNPATRDQNYENAATKHEGSLVDALLKANEGNGGGEVSNATEGTLSSDYTRARGTATANATEDILKRAKLMARNSAGGLMYNDEALKGGQLSSDIAGVDSRINGVNRSTTNSLAMAGNKGSLIGGLMSGFAPSATGYINGKDNDWSSAMNAMNGG
jgi:hypothetical protein